MSATGAQIDQLALYFGLLAKWNNTVNLTALALDPPSDNALDRLFVEPFLAAQFVEKQLVEKSKARVLLLDLGSGGGSPAIPLKIALPDLSLRMVEAKARKSAFLREAVRQLSLSNSDVLNARTEELLAKPELHEAADLVSIRAVRADQRLWNTVSAFAKPGARVLWFRSSADKGQDVVFFPSFLLESVMRLVPADGSELAILRKPD